MVAPEPVSRAHHYSCPCNRCIARRNGRRRIDEERHRSTDQPLPPMSQIYEIERDLPPVYVGDVRDNTDRSAPSRRNSFAGPINRNWDGSASGLLGRDVKPLQPAATPKQPAKRPTKRPPRQWVWRVIGLVSLIGFVGGVATMVYILNLMHKTP